MSGELHEMKDKEILITAWTHLGQHGMYVILYQQYPNALHKFFIKVLISATFK